LPEERKVTFGQYLKSFKKSIGAFAALGFLPVARLGAIVLCTAAICSGYLTIGRVKRPLIFIAFATCAVSFLLYLSLTSACVRKIDIPSRGAVVFVTVGYTRSAFATKAFGNETDWEMLRDRGFSDEEIQRLWTPGSVILARLSLYVAYLGVVLGWTLAFSGILALELSAGNP
jgi:hypothetical protein